MNILHVLSQKELTGAEVYASSLIDAQIKTGCNVYQVSNGFFHPNKATQIALPVETKGFSFWKSVSALRQILIEKNIHVIHGHSRAAAKLVFYARVGLKIGYVSSIHGRQHLSFSKKLFSQYGDFIIPVCKKIADQLIHEFKYNSRRIKIIPNSIDTDKFKFKSVSLLSSNYPLKIAIIGRTSGPKKNRTELFIDRFSQLLDQKGISYQFTIIGGEIKTTIPAETVSFSNINSDVLQKYNLICGSGRVSMEALLSGVPCIAFGETDYIGLITEKNFDTACASNFGDISNHFNLPTFNHDQAQKDIELLLSNSVDYQYLADKTLRVFSLETISKKVMRIYESAYFTRNYSRWIPILMYHKIPDQDLQSQHKIYVNKNNFSKHLHIFKSLNMATLTFDELAQFRKGLKSFLLFPKNPLILTFDDGYEDNLKNADVELKKKNMQAHIYLLADKHVTSNEWDHQSERTEKHKIISGDDRMLWKNSQFTIGSHGLNHQRLPSMSTELKILELSTSKQKLEAEFKQPVITYAYTYGDTNKECAELAETCGYEYALNTDTGGLVLEEDPYAIFRVNIFPDESFLSLWKKTRKWYRRYYYFKRNK
ncbi:MAG: polysaccharide deacetylase family protein [Bdellovibrionaceae bacterium]|nr:polysaccharide deacetylase family protein [Pseudobdellovibrionaceae bacterium]